MYRFSHAIAGNLTTAFRLAARYRAILWISALLRTRVETFFSFIAQWFSSIETPWHSRGLRGLNGFQTGVTL